MDEMRRAALAADQAEAREGNRTDELGSRALQRLTAGKWEMVDWFDADGRRLILIREFPGRPSLIPSPRPGEYEVAGSAALGETGKQICYRLNLSPSGVSRRVRSLMQKLRVRTHPELVMQIRCIGHCIFSDQTQADAS